jgi:farnesyl-diphosphate farnesyltransferase
LLGRVTTRALDPVLRRVSRTIFITLQVAPAATRSQLGIAYLFCRAADTIADTRLLPGESRLEALRRFRSVFEGGEAWRDDLRRIASELGPPQAIPEERDLLSRLEECFVALGRFEAADQARIRKLVATLTQGMEMDLERFPAEESGDVRALETDEDLDLYTYYVAGCVGEFWTDLQAGHLKALASWDLGVMTEKGIRFGKGLQMTNILRDVDSDLAIGRCYLPRERLAAAGVTAEDLRDGRGRDRLRPILADCLAWTLSHYRAGWEYTLSVPRRLPRLRLACAWPLLIGLRTLGLLARSPDPYAPGTRHKASRAEVKTILRRSAARILSNRALERMYGDLERDVSVNGKVPPG